MDEIRAHYAAKTPLEESLHARLTKVFPAIHCGCGECPEAVQRFLDGGRDLGAAREVDADIVEQYRYDIAKYSEWRKLQIRTIFDNIPAQLTKENKRFLTDVGQERTRRSAA